MEMSNKERRNDKIENHRKNIKNILKILLILLVHDLEKSRRWPYVARSKVLDNDSSTTIADI